jgi:hypothetical protein
VEVEVEEAAMAEGSLPTTEEINPILTIGAAHPVVVGLDADRAEAKTSGINSSNPKIRRRGLSRWLRAGTLSNRTTNKGTEAAGTMEEATAEDMAEGSTRISSNNNGLNNNNSLSNSLGITRLNNSEDNHHKPNNMGKTHKCIRQILAAKLKTTKLSTRPREEAGIVEAGEEIVEAEVAEEDTEVDIKEGIKDGIKEGKPMTIQILA